MCLCLTTLRCNKNFLKVASQGVEDGGKNMKQASGAAAPKHNAKPSRLVPRHELITSMKSLRAIYSLPVPALSLAWDLPYNHSNKLFTTPAFWACWDGPRLLQGYWLLLCQRRPQLELLSQERLSPHSGISLFTDGRLTYRGLQEFWWADSAFKYRILQYWIALNRSQQFRKDITVSYFSCRKSKM